ncbi:hypothetical protein AB0C10_37485 [Microbispora amethystogenes]|uniref:hypothetical protein n=1 Tax=Microbispora amethystogenes TaxID=1427754 RepID=UPI0033CC1430
MTITTSTGQEIPVHRGEWVFWRPDGTVDGCMYADAWVGSSEDRAAVRFYGKGDGPKKLAAGYRAELMTRDRWAAEVMPLMLGRADA